MERRLVTPKGALEPIHPVSSRVNSLSTDYPARSTSASRDLADHRRDSAVTDVYSTAGQKIARYDSVTVSLWVKRKISGERARSLIQRLAETRAAQASPALALRESGESQKQPPSAACIRMQLFAGSFGSSVA